MIPACANVLPCANVPSMKLADYKKAHGLSLSKLASLLGFGLSTVHGWVDEKSSRKPGLAAIPIIVKRTHGQVTVADLRPELAPDALYRNSDDRRKKA